MQAPTENFLPLEFAKWLEKFAQPSRTLLNQITANCHVGYSCIPSNKPGYFLLVHRQSLSPDTVSVLHEVPLQDLRLIIKAIELVPEVRESLGSNQVGNVSATAAVDASTSRTKTDQNPDLQNRNNP